MARTSSGVGKRNGVMALTIAAWSLMNNRFVLEIC
jgi:hypothetical protein